MARVLDFRIVNVFALEGERLSGNPLCVFEDARTLDGSEMLALARQFNLSETTFLLPAEDPSATAKVRIFTPGFELPFAGHPTLGSAHVVRDVHGVGDPVILEMKAGKVRVVAEADRWTLETTGACATRPVEVSRSELGAMLGLEPSTIADEPLWVDTGAEQLVVPLRSADDVARARPVAERLAKDGYSAKRGASMAYVWAPSGDHTVTARFFFLSNGSVVEDPATGSACANLGGWLRTKGSRAQRLTVSQGEHVHRPSRLTLTVDDAGRIFVGGLVVSLARGALAI